jgi:hypothetical protein
VRSGLVKKVSATRSMVSDSSRRHTLLLLFHSGLARALGLSFFRHDDGEADEAWE